MPTLPLDHPEPFAATLGVMLYPGTDNHDQAKARAFAAWWLAEPICLFHDAGHRLSYESLARIIMDGGELLHDVDERWWSGTATGELLKALFALFWADKSLASWNNAVKIAGLVATSAKAKSSRSSYWEARRRFVSVAHLWGAWSIREGNFQTRPDVGYDGYADFQSFLTEAEILRRWGQSWRQPRVGSKPPLPSDLWCVPENWEPPKRETGWPETGMIPRLALPARLLATVRPAGRPRNSG
jgi:hypothetical protein